MQKNNAHVSIIIAVFCITRQSLLHLDAYDKRWCATD